MLAHRDPTVSTNRRHREERSDAAIQSVLPESSARAALVCQATLAMKCLTQASRILTCTAPNHRPLRALASSRDKIAPRSPLAAHSLVDYMRVDKVHTMAEVLFNKRR